MSWTTCSSCHAWLQSCDGPVLTREGGAPSDVNTRNDRGRAVDGRTTWWLQPLHTRTDGPAVFRAHPTISERKRGWRHDVSLMNYSFITLRKLKQHIDRGDDYWSPLTHSASGYCFGSMIIVCNCRPLRACFSDRPGSRFGSWNWPHLTLKWLEVDLKLTSY